MNIFKARKLQKELYKATESPFKTSKTMLKNGMLLYVNLYLITSEFTGYVITESFAEGVRNRIKRDSQEEITYLDGYENLPSGMYLCDVIKVD